MARHCVIGFTCHLVFSTTCKVGIIKESICTDGSLREAKKVQALQYMIQLRSMEKLEF